MAKDGTNRGGRRVRAGDKPKPLAEKIAAGEDADIIEFTPTALEGADLDDAADLVGEDMPSPSEYLSARQKDGKPLGADEIYKETWIWLKNRGCEKLVNKRLLVSYSARKRSRPTVCSASTRRPVVWSLLRSHRSVSPIRNRQICSGTRSSIS